NEAGEKDEITSLNVEKGKISLEGLESKDLLVPIFEKGKLVYQQPHIHQIREFVQVELGKLPTEVLKNHDAAVYPVGLSDVLHKEKLAMIAELS
ncbi:MAG: hypothetical protein KDE26_26515, partial [Bacteroidetes bacterium]|nr:hypothetical protein [Bacteroidota bacterium]